LFFLEFLEFFFGYVAGSFNLVLFGLLFLPPPFLPPKKNNMSFEKLFEQTASKHASRKKEKTLIPGVISLVGGGDRYHFPPWCSVFVMECHFYILATDIRVEASCRGGFWMQISLFCLT